MAITSTFHPAELTGRTIGGCRLEKLLGQGGMGAVFLAHHKALDIPVAVKILLPHPTLAAEARERFLREARAAARCRHPNIVGVLNTGEEEGLQFIVMEYVKGGSLGAVLEKRGSLPVDESVAIVLQVLAALGCAAEFRIVHRDVKPDNILIDEKGVVKLADLGLARIIGSDASLTQSDHTVGSPNYIAPEQASNPRSVDQRADIYSLGCVLYHLLSGHPPFGGMTDLEVILKHVTSPVPDLKDLCPGLPDELCAAVRRMMAKEPNDRFQSPEEVLQALTPFAGPAGLAVQMPGRPLTQRRRSWAGFAAIVATALLLAGAFSVAALLVWKRTDIGRTPRTSSAARKTTHVEMRRAPPPTAPRQEPTPVPRRVQPPRPKPADASIDPMTYAVLKGDLSELGRLLDGGANPNRPNHTWTPLHEAVLRGSSNALNMLLDKGASPNAVDDQGDAPLHYAIRMHRADMASSLLDKGANPNMRDRNGTPPLELAAHVGAQAIARKLREKGAN